jgi:protein-arginine kinase activator protein McsA
MKRITSIIAAVLFACSTTLAFAADAVEKILPKQQGEEFSKTGGKPKTNKLKQNSPVEIKTKQKAWGDPHVTKDNTTDKINQ